MEEEQAEAKAVEVAHLEVEGQATGTVRAAEAEMAETEETAVDSEQAIWLSRRGYRRAMRL